MGLVGVFASYGALYKLVYQANQKDLNIRSSKLQLSLAAVPMIAFVERTDNIDVNSELASSVR